MKAHMRPINDFFVSWNRTRYEAEVVHEGLGVTHLVKAFDRQLLIDRAEAKMKQYDKQWDKKLKSSDQQAKVDLSKKQTLRAQERLLEMDSILKRSAAGKSNVKFNMLPKAVLFKGKKPIKPKYPELPVLNKKPPEPQESDFKTNSGCGCLAFMFSTKKADLAKYQTAYGEWLTRVTNIEEENSISQKYNSEQSKKIDDEYKKVYDVWEANKSRYLSTIDAFNKKAKNVTDGYRKKSPSGIGKFFKFILDNCDLPSWIPKKHKTLFNDNSEILAIEGVLPYIDDMPTLESVKYVKTRNEFVEKHLSKLKQNSIYDNVLYQIVLKSIHEIYKWDLNKYVGSIAYSGFVDGVDKATGKKTRPCILSIQVTREEFESLNLGAVAPKECFKKLKGVSSSKLFTLTPVAPVLRIDKDDRRFVDGRAVVDGVSEGNNLAAMNWDDFEHLIRELFEKEFAESGGEVRVTQASRDGGVDAIIFDPDPIRGGKIVVQAKRYTNTVGVSAVRDLYGTLMNEGANKGILVSTSDYGPDAYKFAKGKPLVLLNGGELLYLLGKHGHKARIDIKEAKVILAELEREKKRRK